jgi:hypothetical protein
MKLMKILLAMMVAMLPSLTTLPAHATNFSGASGRTGCTNLNDMVNMQDNSVMTYSRVALTSQFYSATAWVLNNDIAPTDLQLAAEVSVPDANTDVVYQDGYYGTLCGLDWGTVSRAPNLLGITICVSLSGQTCQRSNIFMAEYFATTVSTAYLRAISCHETGHSFGLLHRSDTAGCMPESPGLAYIYTAHDIAHINANY